MGNTGDRRPETLEIFPYLDEGEVKLHLVCGASGNRVWQYVLPLTWLLTLPSEKRVMRKTATTKTVPFGILQWSA